MSNKTQLQTNNTKLDTLIARVNSAKDVAASLPDAGGSGGGGNVETCTVTINSQKSGSIVSGFGAYILILLVDEDGNIYKHTQPVSVFPKSFTNVFAQSDISIIGTTSIDTIVNVTTSSETGYADLMLMMSEVAIISLAECDSNSNVQIDITYMNNV